MNFQPGANLYPVAFGTRPETVEVPHYDSRAPTTTDVLYPVGKMWIWVNNSSYQLLGFTTSQGITTANWVELTDAAGPVESVVGTANQVTVTTAGGTATVSLPSAITTPGSLTTTTSLASGTTVTAGTGITATTGNITATTGNFVASAAGAGIVLTPATASGASPQTANGRSFSVTFTGVSIAAGATQSFTISNSAITGSSTLILLTMIGATTGAALNIQSVTNSASSSVIVVENGTGATTSAANITFIGLLLN